MLSTRRSTRLMGSLVFVSVPLRSAGKVMGHRSWLLTSALTVAVMALACPVQAIAQAGADQTGARFDRTIVTPEPGILLEADNLTSSPDGEGVEATGNVVARSQGRTISAERVTYNRVTGIVEAFGGITIIEANGVATFAESITVDDDLATGIIRSFSARLPEGAVLAADAAIRESATLTRLSRVIYTACPLCEDGTPPTWAIRARRAVQDQDAGLISYSDVVVEVAGVPVGYLPYLAHPDPSAKRKSGLLPAFPSSNSRLGLNMEVPYLFVIDDHSDLTVSPLISQFINPVLQLNYRRAFHSGLFQIEGSGTFERLFGNDSDRFGDRTFRGHAFGEGSFKLNETWRWGFGLETASDETYLLRYNFRGEGRTRGPIRGESGRLISQVFAEAQTDTTFARVFAAGLQDLIGGGRREETPNVVPSAEFRRHIPTSFLNGLVDLHSNLTVLDRREGFVDSVRMNVGAGWRGSMISNRGIITEPHILARGDWFRYQSKAGTDGNFGRAVGQVGVDVRWPLERPGPSITWQLEPSISLIMASDAGRQKDIIPEDSIGYELGRTGLFDRSGVAGQDLWQSGPRVTTGISGSGRFTNGALVEGFLGVQFRDGTDPAFSRSTNLDRARSDLIGEYGVSWPELGSIRARLRYDTELDEIVRTEAWITMKAWRFDLIGRYLDSSDKTFGPRYGNREFEGGFRFRINEDWQLFAASLYNFDLEQTLLGRMGAVFQDDCTELRFYYERSAARNRFVEPSSTFRIQVAFRTFGTLGDNLTDARW